MHGDFRYNLIRFNLLKKAEDGSLKLEQLEDFFKDKAISNVSKKDIKDELEHLSSENFLSKVSENEYKITDSGITEIEEVKKAIEKF